jgi:hypothetical protein
VCCDPDTGVHIGNRASLCCNGASFDVAIVSAGYGLISEERLIAPYNITFKGKGLPCVRERGKTLKLPSMTRELLSPLWLWITLKGLK